ncbi:MAG: hypothetical protein ACK4Z8_05010 [Novosphingobium sp.]
MTDPTDTEAMDLWVRAHYEWENTPVGQRNKAAAAIILSKLNEYQAKIKALEGDLEPFGSFAETFVDEEGWKGSMSKERIVDWFGPSDFRAAQAALKTKETDHAPG